MSNRGYFGIVLYQPKTIKNFGTLIRSATNFGAAFICTVGQRYTRQKGDTEDALRHYPGFHFATLSQCLGAIPREAEVIRVEMDGVTSLPVMHHPERAVYVFGGEDRSVPEIPHSQSIIIPSKRCLNLAVAASIVMYDRISRARGNSLNNGDERGVVGGGGIRLEVRR